VSPKTLLIISAVRENEIDELRECYLVDLLPRLQRIRRLVKQDRSKEWLWINELHELISRCGAGTMQRRIIEQLCPSFLSEFVGLLFPKAEISVFE
jgi:hypothetical protein